MSFDALDVAEVVFDCVSSIKEFLIGLFFVVLIVLAFHFFVPKTDTGIHNQGTIELRDDLIRSNDQ